MRKIIVPVILGPTAAGKTDIAMDIAEKYQYEIVSCDSRQIYRHMNIGTAKPTVTERERVRHWLIDILEPSESYSAFRFAADALRIIRESRETGKKILICGGTGLYYHILANGAEPLSEADLDLRRELESEARDVGSAKLHERLAGVAPEAAAKIHANDLQRIIRALDVYYKKGGPPPPLRRFVGGPEDVEFRAVAITRPREVLYERINRRVSEMVEAGLWNEFLALRGMGYGPASPGMACVGYRELFPVESGEIGIDRAVELIKRNSRRYAKRQMTWFRNKTRAAFADASDWNGKMLNDMLIS